MKVRMLSDGSLIASFLLLNCLLDDMRQGREGKLKRLIQRSHSLEPMRAVSVSSVDDPVGVKSMIDVVVQMKSNQIFTDVRVYSFTLILSVDYLLKIADFWKISEEDRVEPVKPTKGTATPATAKSSVTAAVVEKETQITLNLKVEKPDIVLVEHMDSNDTQALVLNVSKNKASTIKGSIVFLF